MSFHKHAQETTVDHALHMAGNRALLNSVERGLITAAACSRLNTGFVVFFNVNSHRAEGKLLFAPVDEDADNNSNYFQHIQKLIWALFLKLILFNCKYLYTNLSLVSN